LLGEENDVSIRLLFGQFWGYTYMENSADTTPYSS
jgi:hypothetical protein